jgi:hypothetical protein
MSAPAGDPTAGAGGTAGGSGGGAFARLPDALAPREHEPPRSRRRWAIETGVLVLVGVFLLVAVANDLSRQSDVNARLNADLRSWRQYTGHQYHSISVDTQLLGRTSQREVVCGNTTPGPPKERTQLCLMVWGPIRGGVRTVHGGWYLPPRSEDVYGARYGCFGPAARSYCRR